MSHSEDFVIADGILLSYQGPGGEVVVPEGVTTISTQSFYCGVFQNMANLERVVLPEGLQSVDDYTFASCPNLRSVVLPSTLEKIGSNAFKDCVNLREIELPDGVRELESSAFENCASLERVRLPEQLESICFRAFFGCRALKELRFPKALRRIEREAFSGCGLVSVTLPDGLDYLAMEAFSHCADLQEIAFPDGLTRLEYSLLYGCRSLRAVRFPAELEEIGGFCFSACKNLEHISLPAGLREIGQSSFQVCTALTELELPDGLARLDEQAFQHCSSLKRVSLPESLQRIGKEAFYNCGAVDFSCPSDAVLRLLHAEDYVIKKGVLESYQGPGGDVVLPEEVTELGKFSFSGCCGLRSVTFHENIRSIDAHAFSNCGETELIALAPELRQKLADETFEIQNGVLKRYNGMGGDVTIPDGVTSIGRNAFQWCSELRSVRIPEGVTSIEEDAFVYAYGLRSVSLPESLRSIGKTAFVGCESLSEVCLPKGLEQLATDAFHGCRGLADASGLVILNGILFDAVGDAESVTVPSGVRIIAEKVFHSKTRLRAVDLPDTLEEIDALAFYKCGLERVTVPAGVTKVGESAFAKCVSLKEADILGSVETLNETFSGCSALERVTLPEALKKISGDSYSGVFRFCGMLRHIDMNGCSAQLISGCFGEEMPRGLIAELPALCGHMADGALKQYVLVPTRWSLLDDALRAEIFLTRQSKSLQSAYAGCVTPQELPALGNAVLERVQSAKPSAKDCAAAAAYMTLFYEKAPDRLLRSLYAALQGKKTAAKALKTVEEHVKLMERLGASVEADEDLPPLERRVSELLIAEKRNQKDLEAYLKLLYSLTLKDLPPLKKADGSMAAPYVLAWLLTAHEKLEEQRWGQPDVAAAYEQSGLRPEAEEIVSQLDHEGLMEALRKLAKDNLGMTGRSKKMFLAFPICRYADETLMAELTAQAPKWRSSVSGNSAPPLAAFRNANRYSDTRSAMLFAERYRELNKYAQLRGVTEDELRDKNLSNIGLDEQGGKTYDLGSQTVTARLQKDLSFLFELPNGKTAKSLPKKGADEAKFKAAKKDFDEMRKAVKKILKTRGEALFADFLSGRERKSADWQDSYLPNALLRMAGSLVVWAQGSSTFTISDDGPIDSAAQPYVITDAAIRVAHPMEMTAQDTEAWQKYFTARGLKQPFAQVWEPVIDPATIREDRYAGSVQPMYRFTGKDKHGIYGGNLSAFSEDVGFTLEGCKLEYEASTWRVDWDASDAYYTLGKFTFDAYTRRVNHIVSLLDKWTVEDRIRKDDTSVTNLLDSFTLAQITEFITAAQEEQAVNVLAALMEHKNARFADFDPMEEFTLEW